MEPPEPFELFVPKRLDAKAETIDTRVAKLFQKAPVDGLGIGFERNFRIRGEAERTAALVDDGPDFGRRQQRRRPAAEVQSVRGEGCSV